MKHLIIYAHPNESSLNHSFMQTVIESLQVQNNEIEVRDLYQLHFDPALSLDDMRGQRVGKVSEDVKREQDFISWADHIIFIYPIWWNGMPAILKGYIDRVMSYGFAYCYDQGVQKGLLKGKQVSIINTHGKSHTEYESMGMYKAFLLTSDNGIFKYCGLTINQHLYFEKADKASPENIETWVNEIRNVFSTIATTK